MPRWKLIQDKLQRLNNDITLSDITTLLKHYGYQIDYRGKTSGSRIRFTCPNRPDILLHRPHPKKELNEHVIKDLYVLFEQEELWNE